MRPLSDWEELDPGKRLLASEEERVAIFSQMNNSESFSRWFNVF